MGVNILAVIAATAASTVIGMLWYGPTLFGKAWAKAMGFNKADLKQCHEKAGKSMTINLIATLLTAYVLAAVVGYTQVKTALLGAQVALWLWLGFVAPVNLASVLFEGKPVKVYLINMAYYFVSLAAMGAIIAAMA